MKTARILITAALAAASAPAIAADFPNKPVRLVIGFAPGGGTDTTARALASKLSTAFGQQVIVDNRPGHSGTIAADIVSKSTADGHTILLGTIALVVNPSLSAKMPFDTLKDLVPVTRAADSTNILVVHPTVAAKSVKELIALAKAKSLNAGSSGIGGTGHLAVELFNLQAGVKLVHIAYKGGGPAMLDLLGGNIQLIFATAASSIGHIKSGKIRALAVTTAKRSALVPDLPTVAEAGVPGFEANNWNGFLAPAGAPRPVIARLNKEITGALSSPDIKEFLFKQGLDAAPGTPEEFGAYMKQEMAKWAKVIKAAGIKPQ
ncbi:MAG: tripartite tricarboxylate transporter substrate binding protein [Burkholderiales bacterium]|nr:tripartite tricarboxylate transporter substrate binding protein [Burkholderiales bacterium]